MKYAVTKENRSEATTVSVHTKLATAQRKAAKLNRTTKGKDAGQPWYAVRELVEGDLGEVVR